MKEIWKDIPGYEGSYQASNFGKIKSLDRIVHDSIGRHRHLKGRLLKPKLNSQTGYLQVDLSGKYEYIHRLVAKTFLPNPDGFPAVNHKDESRTNNHVSNLEWCTVQYNHDYGSRTKREAKTKSKPVQQLGLDGHVIATFTNAIEASERTGINRHAIQMVAHHYVYQTKDGKIFHYKTAGGYKWKYVEDSKKEGR